MTRLVDRGAISAGYVGIGMAVTIVMSFLLIVPIEGLIWILGLPSGLLIGYYANQRSNRRAGPRSRVVVNGLYAGLVTGLTTAILVLGVKALFFFADNGYRDPGLGGSIDCAVGAGCVYQRYLDAGFGSSLTAAGVIDAGSFTGFYWREQLGSAGMVIALTTLGGLGGAALYGVFGPKPTTPVTVPASR